MATNTSPHNLPIIEPTVDRIKDAAEASALAGDINALSMATNSALSQVLAAASFLKDPLASTVDFDTVTIPGAYPVRFGGNPNAPTGTGPGTLYVGDAKNGTITFITQVMVGSGTFGMVTRSSRDGVWGAWTIPGYAPPQNRLVDFDTLVDQKAYPIQTGENPNGPGFPGICYVGNPGNTTIDYITQFHVATDGRGTMSRSRRNGVWSGWKKNLKLESPQNRLVDFNTLVTPDVYPIQTGDNPNGPGYPGTLYVGEAGNATIDFKTHLHVATDDKGVFYRSARNNVWSSWRNLGDSDLGPDLSSIMKSEFVRSRGGKIGTGGLPVVCLRFDHHLDPFIAQILPILKELKLPWAQAVNAAKLGTGDDNVTYAQLQNHCVNGGGEIYNHGNTHGDAQTISALKYEIIDGFDALNNGLTAMKVEGFMPPGVGDGGYMGWAPIREVERWKSPAAQMVLRRHAVTTAYMGNRYRPLGGHIVQGHSHRVMDGAQPYHWTQSLDIIKRTGTAVTFMLHPSVLTDGQNTIAEIRAGLELVAAARDAGEILVLSPSATFIADIGSSFRRNLANGSTIAAGGSQVIDVFNPDCRGALHELTWTGGGTITVTDSIKQKDGTFLNNTVNVALTGGRGSFYIPYVEESTEATLTLASTASVSNLKLTAV